VWSGASDAVLVFIGEIRTPWNSRQGCPRQGQADGPVCEIVVVEPWDEALEGIERYPQLEVLYWLHRARRDLVLQSAQRDPTPRGTFSLRSPVRPNPIGSSVVTLERREGRRLWVRGLDCLNGTPLLDIKPERKLFGLSRALVA
jgi:tRNA-Thr(GGU) m(6)t(6)A37 methyltransferase TsaA